MTLPRVLTEKHLTREEAADACGVHPDTIYAWFMSGKLEWAYLNTTGGKQVTSLEAIERMRQRENACVTVESPAERERRHSRTVKRLKERNLYGGSR